MPNNAALDPMPVGRTIDLEDIERDPAAWPRTSMDGDRSDLFMDLYAAGGPSALPPVRVIRDPTGGFVLGDGWTRVEAATRLDWQQLPAVVEDAPAGMPAVEAAYLVALGTAATSARPLTRAERHNAIERLITDDPDQSDREIGRLVGVAHTTVGRLRRQLDGATLQPDPAGEPGAAHAADAAAIEIASRMLRALDRVYEARGLGFMDAFLGDRTADRLAEALTAAFDHDALARAARYRTWIDGAIRKLRAAG